MFPEKLIEVDAIRPQAGAAITGDYVSLKNVNMAYIVVTVYQDTADAVAITVEQATNVAGAGHKVITNVVPIWANQDCSTSDAMTRQTDAVNFTTSVADNVTKKVIFQIDPALLDTAGGFDCITVLTAASNATNITEAHYLLEMKYGEDVPPSVIID
jgi:hypothetical protein